MRLPEAENDIIALAKQNDPDAWDWLLKRHAGAMHKFVRKAVRRGADEGDALSFAHEVMIGCVKRFDPDNGVKFFTFLYSSLRMVTSEARRPSVIYVPRTGYETDREAAQAAYGALSLDAPLGHDGDGTLHGVIGCEDGEDENDNLSAIRERLDSILSLMDEREAEVLRLRLEGLSHDEIGERFGFSRGWSHLVSKSAIETASCLAQGVVGSIPPESRYRPSLLKVEWSDAEIRFLKRAVPQATVKEAAMRLGRSIGGTYRKSREKGLRSGWQKRWTPADDQFLRDNRDKGWKWCARALGRKKMAAHNRARRLGIQQQRLTSSGRERMFSLHADGKSNIDIAELLGISTECVRVNLRSRGLASNPRNETRRLESLGKALQEKGVSSVSELREQILTDECYQRFCEPYGVPRLPRGEAVVLEGIRRAQSTLGRPATCHQVATELVMLAEERQRSSYATGWQSVLRMSKRLEKRGLVIVRGSCPKLFGISESGCREGRELGLATEGPASETGSVR